MENDFRDILNNYINGDNQAIEEIYFELKNRLLLIAYNYSRDKNVSKDIVHDVFEKLFHYKTTFRNFIGPGALRHVIGLVIWVGQLKLLKVIPSRRSKTDLSAVYTYKIDNQNKFSKTEGT